MASNPYEPPTRNTHAGVLRGHGRLGLFSNIAVLGCWSIIFAIYGLVLNNAVSGDDSIDYECYLPVALVMLGVAHASSLYLNWRRPSVLWVVFILLSIPVYFMLIWSVYAN